MTLAAHDPSGFPSSVRTQRRDSLGVPLLGFDPPSRYVPKSLLPISRFESHSPGVCAPSAHAAQKSTSRTGHPARAPRNLRPGNLPAVPPAGYGVALRFSQPPSDLLPVQAFPPFSDGYRSWGFALQGFVLPRSPDDSSPPAYPLDVAPGGCAVSVLGWRLPRARVPLPRMARNRVFIVYRVFVLVEIGPIKEPRLMSR